MVVMSNHGHVPHTHPAWIGEIPFILLGTLPALAAFFVIISEDRAYEEHAHAYHQVHGMFAEALRQSADLAADDVRGWRDLLLALGQEALTECAAWIATHRTRPIASRFG